MNVSNAPSNIVLLSSKYIHDFINLHLPEWAVYHSLKHTSETVEACIEIGTGSGLSSEELEIIILAAWFHDVGYVLKVDEHEEISCNMAEQFLTENKFPRHKVDTVLKCICATKLTHTPASVLEKVIKDADLISLGRLDYIEKNNLLRTEMEIRGKFKYSEGEWLTRSYNFLSSHQYHTDYAKTKFSHQVEKNLNMIKSQLEHVM